MQCASQSTCAAHVAVAAATQRQPQRRERLRWLRWMMLQQLRVRCQSVVGQKTAYILPALAPETAAVDVAAAAVAPAVATATVALFLAVAIGRGYVLAVVIFLLV